ncbi:GAF and ANTAR domain-containing protein [Streptomyces longwoodensis]|uniref:GAF and ANTAR domain-containing protein n=1 Tax=Streptomyces longwoodensis TaxID=68231 RepID=UPI00384A64EC
MISDRTAEVLNMLRRCDAAGEGSDLVAAMAAALGMDGVTVALVSGSAHGEALWASDGASRRFEDLQATLGEGPGVDCLAFGTAVRVPDLTQLRPGRWPALAAEVPGQTARAVFCFPLRIGAIVLGVLTLVRRTPGQLTRGQTEEAQALAFALMRRLMDRGPPGLALSSESDGPPLLNAVVHQATGMASVQLAVPLADALLWLRAHAYGSGRTLAETAHDIVAGRLRLAPGTAPPPPAADKD